MLNKQIADRYLIWFSKNYIDIKKKYCKFCKEKDYIWDEDIFSDTYLKIYDIILKNGMKDTTDQGFDNYTFKAFQNNIRNEQRYARNKKRDLNYTGEKIAIAYEDWYNENHNDARVKIINDLWKDFATLYIMMRVENNFDADHFHLFKLKTLIPNMTYKKLAEKTTIKGSRTKVIEVIHWVKKNITKEEIKKEFFELYGNLI